ncbi:MAG TPA: methionyl aminopeptidase [Candidatus Rhabdochlamydia sp.]|jgi:methionyl aminopeptidase|nr:methionyl aminopeptidase [Candidatus Rhabdochlamydia sp.]
MRFQSNFISFTIQAQQELLSYRYRKKYGIILKTNEEIEGIRRSCRLAAIILHKTCAQVEVGVTTNELNDYAHNLMLEANAIPAALGYGNPPFPKSICTSVNDVVCHGIPNDIPLQQGDIINIDITCILNGYYGDCSKMVTLEPIGVEKRKVIKVSYECLHEVFTILKPGLLICEIATQIESHAALHKCSVVRQFVGHGIGIHLHEPPQIPHSYNTLKIPLAAGMTLAIEPMVNAGSADIMIDAEDKWTARTVDKKPSAQWEHTFLITEEGCEILTTFD